MLTRANARAEELVQLNDQLHDELQEKDHALNKAVEMITLYEERFNEHENTCNCQTNKQPEFNEQGTMTDGMKSPNSDSTLKSRGLTMVGISPFSYRNSPSLTTPFRAKFYQSGNVPESPCPSDLIDLNTPCSVAHSDKSLIKAAFLPGNKGYTPKRTSLAPLEFVTRCQSVTSESLAGGEGPPSPTHSNASSDDSVNLSVLSDSSFASMYRSHNNGSEACYGDDKPSPSNCDGHRLSDYLQSLDAPVNTKKSWGLIRVQKIVDALTPSRRASPTRRSPRMEIMEFKDKQERDRMPQSPDMGRNTMPPTPESISPRGAGGFNSSEDGDNDDDGNCCMSMLSPTEVDGQTKATSVDENAHRPKSNYRNAPETSSLNKGDVEITGPRLNPQRSFKFQGGQTTTAAQKEQAFGDITNMRDTHNRLGYGFGDRFGNRDHTGNVKKHVGRDLAYSIRKHVSGHNTSRKESTVTIPVKTAAARGLPVKTPSLTAPPADFNLNTPPYTPNSDSTNSSNSASSTAAVRRLARKGSWESFNSASNSNSDRVTSRGHIDANALKRRNSVATASATKLSVTLNKGLGESVVNIRRQSGIPIPEARRPGGIQPLVRSSSQRVGAKERSR